MEQIESNGPGTGFVTDTNSLLVHARDIESTFSSTPNYAARYLHDLLRNNDLLDSEDKNIATVRDIISRLDEGNSVNHRIEVMETFLRSGDPDIALEAASKEIKIRRKIEEYYLPKQLVEAIVEKGEIPQESEQCVVGIGFIDIADYTFLSKFLTPMENQIVLNGLYAAFSWVLQQHGGYLNKIEGDSLMFHYGGNIDPKIRDLDNDEAEKYIAQELFYTCIHMQRVAFLFNQANDSFLYGSNNKIIKKQVSEAFKIISSMRNSELAQSINAFFQIRIRIGANIGEVTIGNFGPEGGKQWDIIGVPVINAKRMESTAPIGGFRISEELYRILEDTGVTEAYFHRFKREAEAMFGSFSTITRDELFKYGKVTLKDKRDAEFNSYSIQVNPALPEALMNQVELLINREHMGALRIIQMLQYYRGNKFVINAIEATLVGKGIEIRKAHILKYIFPLQYQSIINDYENNLDRVEAYVSGKYSLFDLFEMLGSLQDTIKKDLEISRSSEAEFTGFEDYIARMEEWVKTQNDLKEKRVYQRNYFYNFIYPMVFKSINGSILEYQHQAGELSEVV